MTIKQFNGTYYLHEDRVLFRFNTQNQEEYRFWFTRRTTLFLLAATTHLLAKKLEQMHSPDAAKAINEFEKQAILDTVKSENSQAQIYESGVHFPLGFDPILVMDVTCSLTQNGQKIAKIEEIHEGQIDDALSVDFILPGGANINLKLAGSTLQTMRVLLDQLRIQAGWGEAVLQTTNMPTNEEVLQTKSSKNTAIH